MGVDQIAARCIRTGRDTIGFSGRIRVVELGF